jgi:ribosomal protein L36
VLHSIGPSVELLSHLEGSSKVILSCKQCKRVFRKGRLMIILSER